MSDEYRCALILCDEITRKLADLSRFDLTSLIDDVHYISDLGELAWVRNHLLVVLSDAASMYVRDIEKLRTQARPLLPEVRALADGSLVRVWSNVPTNGAMYYLMTFTSMLRKRVSMPEILFFSQSVLRS
jgi:hypothetical protein